MSEGSGHPAGPRAGAGQWAPACGTHILDTGAPVSANSDSGYPGAADGLCQPGGTHGLRPLSRTSPRAAGVDALLTVDIPAGGSEPRSMPSCSGWSMDNIFLVAPTTPDERIEPYCGRGQRLHLLCIFERRYRCGAPRRRRRCRPATWHVFGPIHDLPLAVGFGIKDADSAAAIAAVIADGVVVGSALVDRHGPVDRCRGPTTTLPWLQAAVALLARNSPGGGPRRVPRSGAGAVYNWGMLWCG